MGPEAPTIAVVDSVPLMRRGLAAALADAGFAVEQPDDVLAWVGQLDRPLVVVVSVRAPEDGVLAAGVRSVDETVPLVALVSEDCPEAYREALRVGAGAVASVRAPVEELVEVVEVACRGWALLPSDVVRALAGSGAAAPDAPALTPGEVALLRTVAAGTPVEEFARAQGFSEREVYRRLERLRDRLGGVQSRGFVGAGHPVGVLALGP